MQLKLTYIVPAYNASKCIRKTLESIFDLPLSERDFEVIVVDDCSTDNTLKILREIEQQHSNLVVLHQNFNQRQGAARNRGIEIASGDYIAFCDADDEIVPEGVFSALQAVDNTQADICYFDFEYELSTGKWKRFELPIEIHNTTLASADYLNNYYTCFYNAPWRCLYRAEFLRTVGVCFVEGVRWEDCDWTVKVLSKAKQVQFVEGVGYRYAFNEDSTSKLKTVEAMSERVFAGLRLMEYGDEVGTRLPQLSKLISDEGRNYYVKDIIRLRNLTKYTFKENKNLYSFIGYEKRISLSKYTWALWETLFLNHRALSLLLLFFLCPLAAVGRKLIKYKRDMLKS